MLDFFKIGSENVKLFFLCVVFSLTTLHTLDFFTDLESQKKTSLKEIKDVFLSVDMRSWSVKEERTEASYKESNTFILIDAKLMLQYMGHVLLAASPK